MLEGGGVGVWGSRGCGGRLAQCQQMNPRNTNEGRGPDMGGESSDDRGAGWLVTEGWSEHSP